jgi:hypothetical protein
MWIVILAFLIVLTAYTVGKKDGREFNQDKIDFLLSRKDHCDDDK